VEQHVELAARAPQVDHEREELVRLERARSQCIVL